MTTIDFIIELFCRVDDAMQGVKKHSQALLYPSEIVTLGLLFALKGTTERAFYRWIERDLKAFFPHLPHRTRLFQLFATHFEWTERFLADPTVLGVADSYGVELIPPKREGRSQVQIGKKGKSNHRWIIGGKLCVVLNQRGEVVDWACDTANVHDPVFHPLIEPFDERMVMLTDTGFHAKAGDPPNMKICKRGTWNVRMRVETVFSMVTNLCQAQRTRHRVWRFFQARRAFPVALYNLLIRWDGLAPDDRGFLPLSIARFSL